MHYQIKEVKSRKDIKQFINFPLELYKDCPLYVPMLLMDERKIFKKNYVYNNTCKTVFYLAINENNKVVGRIEGIIQIAANEKWKQQRVRFTRIDFINDQEVANLLLDAVAAWGKSFGMTELVGPLGYSDLEREGLLVEGFDKIQTYEEQYNFEYYQDRLENYGLKKEVDWLEVDQRLLKISKLTQKNHGISLYNADKVSTFIKKYKKEFFEIIDTTYNKIYGTVPFTKEMMDASISNFKLILRPQDLTVVLDKDKKVIGFGLMFPSISKIVAKYKGKIGLRFLIDFFKNKKNPEIIDLGLIGVLEEYRASGVAAVLMEALFTYMTSQAQIKHLETNLMLETNENILGLTSAFEREFTKRRRCYVKDI